MKKKLSLFVLGTLLLSGCAAASSSSSTPSDTSTQSTSVRITAEQAKAMMNEQGEYTLLDVRTQQEYDEEHIEGAMLIPNAELAQRAEAELPNKDMLIIVYCRSGGRSAMAAQTLLGLGYTNVYDIGGITSWPYGTVKP